MRVAIVGAGPSGLYAVDHLLKQTEVEVNVDLFEQLPVPFGLVRYGVAPDHFSLRNVRNTLEKILDDDRVRLLANVAIGTDVTVAELHEYYDAIIFAYGTGDDRNLGIDGEDARGSLAARTFVNWYCGHPDQDREPVEAVLDPSTIRSVVVVGAGNVALDVVRMFVTTDEILNRTDMPQHVLDLLTQLKPEQVHVLSRRGPVEASFTTKELREMGELPNLDVVVDPASLELHPSSQELADTDRLRKRNLDVFAEWAQRSPGTHPQQLHMHFFTRPVGIGVEDGAVVSVDIETTELDDDGRVQGTGQVQTIPADLVIRSIGYYGNQLEEVPFDEWKGVIPNEAGRVLRDGVQVPGQYVVGWIKRGPSGVVGTNRKDAVETVQSLLADRDQLVTAGESRSSDVTALLTERGVEWVEFDGWGLINAAEIALGQTRGRDRTTLHERKALLAAAKPPQ